jgi:hypothetical protein
MVAKVEYLDHGKSKGFIELGQVQQMGGAGPLVSAPSTTVTYARTEHTVGWVKMPATITDALKELDKIVSGE